VLPGKGEKKDTITLRKKNMGRGGELSKKQKTRRGADGPLHEKRHASLSFERGKESHDEMKEGKSSLPRIRRI